MPANKEKTHFHQLLFFGPAVGREDGQEDG